MNIFQMSLSATAMIIAVVIVRALALYKLPKGTFLVLWGIVLCRLLIPFSIPYSFSFYTGINTVKHMMAGTAVLSSHIGMTGTRNIVNMPSTGKAIEYSAIAVSPVKIIWLVGLIVCIFFFITVYIKNHKEFQTALPITNDFISRWLQEHTIWRHVQIRQSDRINAPLTYGIFRPVILLPKTIKGADETTLRVILTHELTHIRRFDSLTKLVLALACSIHWFNPFVWIMCVLANRDIELSCDETVVNTFGDTVKSTYAMLLINMEEKKSKLIPLVNYFSKNAIEERIVSIMKLRKTSLMGIMFAFTLVIATTAVFATNATYKNDKENEKTPVTADNPSKINHGTTSSMSVGPRIMPLESRKMINIDLESLKSEEKVCIGTYTLEEKDYIVYNITSEGKGNLNVWFSKPDPSSDNERYLGYMGLQGNSLNNTKFPNEVKNEFMNLAGTYKLWISNGEGETLRNIKGSVQIAFEADK